MAKAMTARQDDAASKPGLKLWALRAKNVQEPPFFHTGVPAMMLVAADTEDQARRLAAAGNPEAALPNSTSRNAWTEESLVTCEEFAVTERGVVARA